MSRNFSSFGAPSSMSSPIASERSQQIQSILSKYNPSKTQPSSASLSSSSSSAAAAAEKHQASNNPLPVSFDESSRFLLQKMMDGSAQRSNSMPVHSSKQQPFLAQQQQQQQPHLSQLSHSASFASVSSASSSFSLPSPSPSPSSAAFSLPAVSITETSISLVTSLAPPKRLPGYKIRFLLRWFNSLRLVPVQLDEKSLTEEMRTGVLLARLLEVFVPSHKFVGLHKKALTAATAISNLEKCLELIFKKTPRRKWIASAQDIFDGNQDKVIIMLFEVFEVFIMREVRAHVKKVFEFFNSILLVYARGLYPATFQCDHTSLWQDFSDCAHILCILHYFAPPQQKPDLSRVFWLPETHEEQMANIEQCFHSLRAMGLPILWSVEDWKRFDDDDMLATQLTMIYRYFRDVPRPSESLVGKICFADHDRIEAKMRMEEEERQRLEQMEREREEADALARREAEEAALQARSAAAAEAARRISSRSASPLSSSSPSAASLSSSSNTSPSSFRHSFRLSAFFPAKHRAQRDGIEDHNEDGNCSYEEEEEEDLQEMRRKAQEQEQQQQQQQEEADEYDEYDERNVESSLSLRLERAFHAHTPQSEVSSSASDFSSELMADGFSRLLKQVENEKQHAREMTDLEAERLALKKKANDERRRAVKWAKIRSDIEAERMKQRDDARMSIAVRASHLAEIRSQLSRASETERFRLLELANREEEKRLMYVEELISLRHSQEIELDKRLEAAERDAFN